MELESEEEDEKTQRKNAKFTLERNRSKIEDESKFEPDYEHDSD